MSQQNKMFGMSQFFWKDGFKCLCTKMFCTSQPFHQLAIQNVSAYSSEWWYCNKFDMSQYNQFEMSEKLFGMSQPWCLSKKDVWNVSAKKMFGMSHLMFLQPLFIISALTKKDVWHVSNLSSVNNLKCLC